MSHILSFVIVWLAYSLGHRAGRRAERLSQSNRWPLVAWRAP